VGRFYTDIVAAISGEIDRNQYFFHLHLLLIGQTGSLQKYKNILILFLIFLPAITARISIAVNDARQPEIFLADGRGVGRQAGAEQAVA
jgi:hypothetical protein